MHFSFLAFLFFFISAIAAIDPKLVTDPEDKFPSTTQALVFPYAAVSFKAITIPIRWILRPFFMRKKPNAGARDKHRHFVTIPTYANWTQDHWNVFVQGHAYIENKLSPGKLDKLVNRLLIRARVPKTKDRVQHRDDTKHWKNHPLNDAELRAARIQAQFIANTALEGFPVLAVIHAGVSDNVTPCKTLRNPTYGEGAFSDNIHLARGLGPIINDTTSVSEVTVSSLSAFDPSEKGDYCKEPDGDEAGGDETVGDEHDGSELDSSEHDDKGHDDERHADEDSRTVRRHLKREDDDDDDDEWEAHSREASLAFVPPKGLTIFSDIDDILRVAEIWNPKQAILSTLARPFKPWRDMPQIYSRWSDSIPGVHFHYSSETAEVMSDFYINGSLQHYPPGSWDFRPMDLVNWQNIVNPREASLKRILETFPERRFVLVGDTVSPAFMNLVPKMALKFPDQIQCILIRDVMATEPSNWRVSSTKAFLNLPTEKYHFFRHPSDLLRIDPDHLYNLAKLPLNETYSRTTPYDTSTGSSSPPDPNNTSAINMHRYINGGCFPRHALPGSEDFKSTKPPDSMVPSLHGKSQFRSWLTALKWRIQCDILSKRPRTGCKFDLRDEPDWASRGYRWDVERNVPVKVEDEEEEEDGK
ncbi:hypothetical protein K461DRAFT_292219 [Myriangium duriaei CBS 260.36]|uniref:Phosphatidate phosphatase APP1 catalytic domain-containing protein n=1 Tax=Myriangium duriaei CBS 260.36 TaxID=1168546 RepID=A0A9P4J5T5_9PEZI|nr:hypothetical protein K461DRAFT_292219 [Myriangium duriaei CBS 260.36]